MTADTQCTGAGYWVLAVFRRDREGQTVTWCPGCGREIILTRDGKLTTHSGRKDFHRDG